MSEVPITPGASTAGSAPDGSSPVMEPAGESQAGSASGAGTASAAVPPVFGSPFERVKQEIDRWLEAARLTGERALDAVGLVSESRPVTPGLDLFETEADVHVLVDLPGVSADHVELSLTGQTLLIRAVRSPSPLMQHGATIHLRERLALQFERQCVVPVPIDPETVRAVVRDGLLHVTLHKSPQIQARVIPIQRPGV